MVVFFNIKLLYRCPLGIEESLIRKILVLEENLLGKILVLEESLIRKILEKSLLEEVLAMDLV